MSEAEAVGSPAKTTEVSQIEAEELASLRLEKEMLSGQVKRLVKAEGRLYQYQEQLDAQLREDQELYRLNRKLGASLELAAIFAHASDFIINNLGYQRVLFLQHRENSGDYAVCAWDGYYETGESASLAEFVIPRDAAVLAPLAAGEELLLCEQGSQGAELKELGGRLRLGEYLLYPLGSHDHPVALLIVGNDAENAPFYRRVGGGELALLGIGNLVALLSSSIENQILFAGTRKALELERLAEAKYRGIFENAMEGIFQTTPGGRFISCNPATADILGYPGAKEVIDGVIDVGQLYVDRERRKVLIRELASGKKLKAFEIELYRRDGSRCWVRLGAQPVFGDHGELLYLDCIMEDISERKEAELALQELNFALERRVAERTSELESANEELQQLSGRLESAYLDLKSTQSRMLQQEKMASIGQLAAGVAHEINNPMGFIISNLNTLGK